MSIFLKAAPVDGHKLSKLGYLTKRTGRVAMLAAASYKAQICHSLISFPSDAVSPKSYLKLKKHEPCMKLWNSV